MAELDESQWQVNAKAILDHQLMAMHSLTVGQLQDAQAHRNRTYMLAKPKATQASCLAWVDRHHELVTFC